MIKSIQVFNDMDGMYKFYQIRKVYDDGSFWTVCYVDEELSGKVMEIAKIIASTYEVEVKDMREIPGMLLQH